jgi:hypothetical protein
LVGDISSTILRYRSSLTVNTYRSSDRLTSRLHTKFAQLNQELLSEQTSRTSISSRNYQESYPSKYYPLDDWHMQQSSLQLQEPSIQRHRQHRRTLTPMMMPSHRNERVYNSRPDAIMVLLNVVAIVIGTIEVVLYDPIRHDNRVSFFVLMDGCSCDYRVIGFVD